MDTYQLLEQIKELEAEIERLRKEQQTYKKMLEARHPELSNNPIEVELISMPIWISQYARKCMQTLSQDEPEDIQKQRLEKRLNEAVESIIQSYR
jgi:hypothetical protein